MFKIILPDNFHTTFDTPWKLMKEVAYVDEPLYLAPGDSRNQWDIRNNKKLYWPSKNPIYFVIQFIHNTISSNIFLYQNYGMHNFTGDHLSNEVEQTEGMRAFQDDNQFKRHQL